MSANIDNNSYPSAEDSLPPVNINVGILGHVDSGKTSLAKALSRIASTACFDKNPQSQERGITLDLGFSAFFIDVPSAAASAALAEEDRVVNAQCRKSFRVPESEPKSLSLQYTLVDCPGHASLIRAVMGAAHIIDLMILVIDITKGIQTQTAECIVLGEMLGRKLVVVLNKIDLVPGETEEEKRETIEKKKKALRNVFARTRWPNAPFVEISANPGSSGKVHHEGEDNSIAASTTSTSSSSASQQASPIGIDRLKNTLKLCAGRMAESDSLMSLNKKKLDPTQFFMMVDHCFGVKGHGTVLTGTVVGGTVSVADEVKIPDLGLSRRVKSIQVFRKPVQTAHCGDRIGLCITQVNADRLERGIACSAAPNSPVLTIHHACVCSIAKVRFFKGEIESSNMIFHVTIGHVTAMATMRFFSLTKTRKDKKQNSNSTGAVAAAPLPPAAAAKSKNAAAAPSSNTNLNSTTCLFDFNLEYEYEERITESAVQQFAEVNDEKLGAKNPEDAVGFLEGDREYFAVLLVDRPVTAVVGSKIIASHLDSSEKTSCRLAMHGRLLTGEVAECIPPALGTFEKDDKEAWRALRVVKYRERQINIDRVIDARSCVARPPKTAAQIQQEMEEREKKRIKREKMEKKKAEKAELKLKTANQEGHEDGEETTMKDGNDKNNDEDDDDDEPKSKTKNAADENHEKELAKDEVGGKKGNNNNNEKKGKNTNKDENKKNEQQQQQISNPESSTNKDDPTAPAPAIIIPVVFHQPIVELTKFVGFPVIFRRRVKRSRNENVGGDENQAEKENEGNKKPNKNNNNNKKKSSSKSANDDKNNNDGDDDDETVSSQQQKQSHQKSKTDGGDGENKEDEGATKSQPLPRFVDIRGKIDSVIGGSGGKVKVVFGEEAFEGNRAFGNVLLLDKKYPFSTSFKVEADS